MSDHKSEERSQELGGSLTWRGAEIKPFPLMCGLSGSGSRGLGEDRARRLISVKETPTQESMETTS